MRFRLGAHNLQVVVGRWARSSRDSGGRACQWCTMRDSLSHLQGWVEDEKHVLMECSRYIDIRQRFSGLLADCHGDMQQLMCHPNHPAVAHFVHAVLVRHAQAIVCSDRSSSGPTTEWEDDLSELVEILSASSGEMLLSTLLDEHEATPHTCGGDLALEPGDTQGSDEVLSEDIVLSTLLHECE